MLSQEKNALVTQIGPETGCGAVMRRFWQPAALVEELDDERPVLAVQLLGEDLVLFRDDDGRYGLIGRHCAHRGADLCFGRREDGGLRCPFHGWLFDVNGRCLEQPAEPPGSNFHTKIRHTAYPCEARNGIVFAYMGPGDPPPLPDADCFTAPDDYTFAFKGYLDCNWLQTLEVGIDPSHASFLHRFFEDERPGESYGQQFRHNSGESDIPLTKVMRDYTCPEINVEETGYGLRISTLRDLDAEKKHIRITNLMFPNAIVIPISNDMNLTQWHVPIDDTRSWWYAIFSAFEQKVDKKTMREDRLQLYSVPDYMPRLNRSNNYGFDAKEQRTQTYTGMGMDINVHDTWAVESPGPVQDRTVEHLGVADKAIITNRRLLLQAIEAVAKGGTAPFSAANGDANPLAIDTVGPAADWQSCWRGEERKRRGKSGWAKAAV